MIQLLLQLGYTSNIVKCKQSCSWRGNARPGRWHSSWKYHLNNIHVWHSATLCWRHLSGGIHLYWDTCYQNLSPIISKLDLGFQTSYMYSFFGGKQQGLEIRAIPIYHPSSVHKLVHLDSSPALDMHIFHIVAVMIEY